MTEQERDCFAALAMTIGILRLTGCYYVSLMFLPKSPIRFATGNTARIRNLDCGMIEPGRAATFMMIDRAQHSPGKTVLKSIRRGDLPGIGMVIIDGIVSAQRSRNTPPATTVPEIVKQPTENLPKRTTTANRLHL